VRIALAHNKNDVAETMIHNLGRGTGLRGLSTMRPCTGNIIRPVLCMERKEILAYLEQKQISYIVDSSNLSDEYTRNRIRHHILPLMEQEVNERAAAHMAETARQIAQAEDYLCRMGREALLPYQKEDKEYLLADSFFEAEPVIVNYALWCAFETLAGKRKDFTSLHLQQVRELAGKQTGRQISLPYDLVAERTYGGVRIAKKEQKTIQSVEWELPLPGVLTCPFGTFETKIFSYEGQKIEEKKYTKWLDYDKIGYNLCIRTRRPGDFLIVNKEGNKKKINRCMIDDKIPKSQRETIPLVACGSEILWMIGGRMNEKYKITPETGRVLELQCQGGKCNE
jgi:tRNA(Ile)-lysidine synthase